MKYLHSGYILLCDKADLAEDGRINARGLFDLFVVKNFPSAINCHCVIGFGTPYERRQYKGHLEIEDPSGRTVVSKDFNANDPNDLFRGHSIIPLEFSITSEGSWTMRCSLYNWKNENVWDVTRQFWAMLAGDGPPDP